MGEAPWFVVLYQRRREDFENDYWQHVAKNLDDYYSNFVSRFVIEFAGLLMPLWRVSLWTEHGANILPRRFLTKSISRRFMRKD